MTTKNKIEQFILRIAAKRRSKELSYWPSTFDQGADIRWGFPRVAREYLRGRYLKGAIKAYENALSCASRCSKDCSPSWLLERFEIRPTTANGRTWEDRETIQKRIDRHYGNLANRYEARLERLRRVEAGTYKGLAGEQQ